MSSSGTDSEAWKRGSEKTAFGQKQTKSLSVRESCHREAETALGIPCPHSKMFARMVPSTCQFYLHFRDHLSPGWTWLCLYHHPTLAIHLGPGGVTKHHSCLEGSMPLDLHIRPWQTQPLGPHQDAGGKGKLLKRPRPTEKQTLRRKRNHGQHRLRGEIKTKELVSGYPRSVSLQSIEMHLQLCPFPDTPQLNLFKAEPLWKSS